MKSEKLELGLGLNYKKSGIEISERLGLLSHTFPTPDSGCTTDWVFSWHEDIRMKVKKICFDDAMGPDRFLSFWDCHQGYGNQLYKYLKESQVSYTL